MSMDAKILNILLANIIQKHSKRIRQEARDKLEERSG